MAKLRILATNEVMDIAPDTTVVVLCPDNRRKHIPVDEVEFVPNNYENDRKEFAKAAMQSLILRGGMANDRLVKRSFEIADAMLKQLTKDG
jgi:hypothetical protein